MERVAMGSRAREVLALLLERPSALVPKNAIMDAVWSRVAVKSNNLSVQIAAIRKTLLPPGRRSRLLMALFRFLHRAQPDSTCARTDAMLLAPPVSRSRLASFGRPDRLSRSLISF